MNRTGSHRVFPRSSPVPYKSRMSNQTCNNISPCHSDPCSTAASPADNRFVDSERSSTLLRGMAALYEHKQFVDVTIHCGDKEFQCHKNVLAISSPFFMAMFSNDLAESRQDQVHIKEMDSRTMESILDYIYTGEVNLCEDTVQCLLSAANLFQLLPLRNGCAEYMVKHVNVANCLGMFFFAKAHQCEMLASKAKEIINSRFEGLCKEQEFLVLPADKLVDIIKDDQVNVMREETIYESCLAWMNYSIEDRKDNLFDVMKYVRFSNISSYYFCDNIDRVALLQGCPPLKEILDTVKYFHMLKNRQHELDLNFLPRKGMTYDRAIIIMANPYCEDNSKKFNSMSMLLPKKGECRHLCKLPQSLYMPGACTTGDNQIFLAGGAIRKINYRGPFVTEGVSANLFLYDRNFGSWQVKSKMTHGRCQFSLVMVDGTLYAIGGQNEAELLDSVEQYDTLLNSWSAVAPLPQRMRCMTAVSFKGRIYVFGGESQGEISKATYMYDPTEDTWLKLPPMNVPRALAGSVVYREKIYVIGGNSAISAKWRKEFLPEHCVSSVEIFDPVSQTWSFGPELPNALCGAGVVKYGETIMVVGGEDDKSWMAGLFTLRHDSASGKDFWIEGQELSTVMSTFGCVVANIPRELYGETDLNI